MTPLFQTALDQWPLPVTLTLAMILVAGLYLRGWVRLHASAMHMISGWCASSFLLGLLLLWIAIGSPLAEFDEQLLTVHMLQHLLLMTIAPALILLGAPVMPLLHGLPQPFVKAVLGPVFRWPPLQRAGHFLSQPLWCWLAATTALVGWHIPAAFALGLHSEAWHVVEHCSFLFAGFLFWWPVVQPWPSVTRWSRWSILLYLFLATLPCDVLSGFLVFSERVVYPVYSSRSMHLGMTVLQDQECAGALMWTCITILYLVPAAVLTIGLLETGNRESQTPPRHPSSAAKIPSPATVSPGKF